MAFKIGSIPYLNGAPLVMPLRQLGCDSPVEVVTTVPSGLPALLESGEVEAILVSSIDALRNPDRRICGNVCVGSKGRVESVRLFSRKPFGEIRTLAEDASSMTSNALAKIILAERYGVHPEAQPLDPNLGAMLERADACILIGDNGMEADGTGFHVLDLGQAWVALTGKPFVWALWVGSQTLDPRLCGWLDWAREHSGCGPEATREPDEQLIRQAAESAGIGYAKAYRYLTQTITYHLDDVMLDGLREFQKRLQAQGLVPPGPFPRIVEPVPQGQGLAL